MKPSYNKLLLRRGFRVIGHQLPVEWVLKYYKYKSRDCNCFDIFLKKYKSKLVEICDMFHTNICAAVSDSLRIFVLFTEYKYVLNILFMFVIFVAYFSETSNQSLLNLLYDFMSACLTVWRNSILSFMNFLFTNFLYILKITANYRYTLRRNYISELSELFYMVPF